MGATSSERERGIERAMRAHPAGRALGERGRPRPAPVVTDRPAGRAPSGPAPRVRLTARGRLVVAALALASATGAVAASGVLSGGGTPSLHLEGQSSVVVRPGDTLWSIASAVAGEGDDVRQVVARIREVNGLRSTVLVPGEVLRLP